jgi:hypothetical protein
MGKTKCDKTYRILGYTANELKCHIQSDPNWSEICCGKWHIDHIFPVKAFLDHGIHDIGVICRLDNLRPLSAKENLVKNARYDKQEFCNWLEIKGIQYVSPNSRI